MRPVYVSKLFELLRWLEVPQHMIARHLGATESCVSMWANGQRPLPKRQKEAFLEFASTAIAQAYAPLKATLAAGIAREQTGVEDVDSLVDLEQGLHNLQDTECHVLAYIGSTIADGDPLKQKFHDALHRVTYMKQCLDAWKLELVVGDGSLYHEFAEALKTLRPFFLLTEEELRLKVPPGAQEAREVWNAGTTLTWCARTLQALGPTPEYEQVCKPVTTQAQQDEPSRTTSERSRRTPVGSASSR